MYWAKSHIPVESYRLGQQSIDQDIEIAENETQRVVVLREQLMAARGGAVLRDLLGREQQRAREVGDGDGGGHQQKPRIVLVRQKLIIERVHESDGRDVMLAQTK